MKTARLPLLAFFGSFLLLGGCASFDADTDALIFHKQGVTKLTRFFVLSNLNDNHALDRRIVEALQARGLTADSGPMTMMPDNTQAVISFQDRWSWDFGEHLVYLKLSACSPDSNEILAAATFSATIPLKEPVPQMVGRLVARLFDSTPTAPPVHPGADQADPAGTGKKRAR